MEKESALVLHPLGAQGSGGAHVVADVTRTLMYLQAFFFLVACWSLIVLVAEGQFTPFGWFDVFAIAITPVNLWVLAALL